MIAVTIAGMLRGSATLLNLWKQQLGRTEFFLRVDPAVAIRVTHARG